MNLKRVGIILLFVLLFSGLFYFFSGNITGNAVFSSEIPNFVFEKNSGWNDAFSVLDYFEVSGHPSGYYFSENPYNIDGEFIESDFTVGGGVKFRPAVDFIGSKEFELHIEEAISNKFNVTIVENLSENAGFNDKNVKYGSQNIGGLGVFGWALIFVLVLLGVFGVWFFILRKKGDSLFEEAQILRKNSGELKNSPIKT